MSNPVQRGPGNDAFGGGALIRAAPPTSGPTGALPGSNTSTPLGGVNPPSTPFFARPNSGTNIRIPYNRVVPLSDPRGGGLTAVVKSDMDEASSPEEWYTHMHADTQSKTLMSETDTLHATRIAFVLAKKSSDTHRTANGDIVNNQDFSYAINSAIAPTLPGTQKLQKLCSLEYLQRYVDKVANAPGYGGIIDLGARPAATNATDSVDKNKYGVPELSGNRVKKWATKAGLLGDIYREAKRRQDARANAPGFAPFNTNQGAQDMGTYFMRKTDETVVAAFATAGAGATVPDAYLQAINTQHSAFQGKVGFSGLPPVNASLIDIGDLGRLNSAVGKGVNYNPALSLGTGSQLTHANGGTDPEVKTLHAAISKKICADSGQSKVYQALRQGIFTMDEGPFLRGLGMDAARMLVKAGFVGALEKLSASDYSEGRCRGDDVAFAVLDDRLMEMGLFDWTPDGILLSKFDNTPLDKLEDQRLDARDGALYNVCIQGPALTTTWTGDPSMEVLPMDKVFVVVIGDVLLGDLQLSEKLPVGPVADNAAKDAAFASFTDAVDALNTFQLITAYNFVAAGGGAGAVPSKATALTDNLKGDALVQDAGRWFPVSGTTWANGAALTAIGGDALGDVRAQMAAALNSIGSALRAYKKSDGTGLTLPDLAGIVAALPAADAPTVNVARTAVHAALRDAQTEVHDDAIKNGVQAPQLTAAADLTMALLNLQVQYVDGFDVTDIDTLNTTTRNPPKNYFAGGDEYYAAFTTARRPAQLAAANKINAMLPSSVAQMQIVVPADASSASLPGVEDAGLKQALETFSAYLRDENVGSSGKKASRKEYVDARARVMQATQLVKRGDGSAAGSGLGKNFALGPNAYEEWKKEAEIEYNGSADKLTRRLCNFRVQLATSSQIINSSELKFDSNGEQMPGSRMGLKLGMRVSEYIVGGWCIGTVTDAAASRASMPSGMPMGPRSAPNTAAINLHVNIEWWNGDKMHRAYCNYKGKDEGLIRPRFQRPEQRDLGGGRYADILEPVSGSVNLPAERVPDKI